MTVTRTQIPLDSPSPKEIPPLYPPQGEERQAAARSETPRESRGERIPDPFILTGAMRQWAEEHHPGVDVEAVTQSFVDYWRGIPGARGRKLDWAATWRNAFRNGYFPKGAAVPRSAAVEKTRPIGVEFT